MKQLGYPDGNILGLTDGRSLDSRQVPYPYQEPRVTRALQMHSSLVQRLSLSTVMEGHQGCVNALAWNKTGSLLLSGSDDTRANIWDYATQKLLYSVDTGHSANIFCIKFMPETGDEVVVSGAGDAEVRVHRIIQGAESAGSGPVSEPSAIFRCHERRVKKLAVENGNPHVIWSASEDGTLRQHDLREGESCSLQGSSDHECRNVLIDLRGGAKRSLSSPSRHCLPLKTCAISPTRPHHLLIGGSDAFARLYDRRMLPPPTSSQSQSKPPPCVCYFCPVHLSDHSRSGLHLTHVTFSPDGKEVLLSYSGEHVYLMDANCASDVPKRTLLTPMLNGTNIEMPVPSVDTATLSHRRNIVRLQECEELLDEARRAMEEGNCLYAIEASSEVIDAGGRVMGPGLRHDCLCLRAVAFLKRGWKNDIHMAIRDCNEARAINQTSIEAHYKMSEALSQLGKHKDALEFAMRAYHLDPSDNFLSEQVTKLRAKLTAAEVARNNTAEREAKGERQSRIRTLSKFLFRSDPDQSDSSQESRRADRDESDVDEDMEMEMEIEMSVSGDDERNTEPGARPTSSLNLRLRRRGDPLRDRGNSESSTGVSESTSASNSENSTPQVEVAVDMRQRYVGHCNTGTDIKQASFLGERGEFIASGSDDGRWFIWHKKTGRLLKMLAGDESVVNCVQGHPFDCSVATSGIDSSIKLWTPCADGPSVTGGVAGPESGDLLRIMVENQHQMRRHREIGLPFELLQRIRVHDGPEGAAHPFECSQS
ncbi:hypothetical protein O6H91_22G057700 [Diphasiastrum complanatum]|uniref:Uncharacterized protein n=4 Tax=Diphasiastrum complanatum TaxID=34168 RepID=A0ACC2AFT2_DIPCM|nr:hypothetical protein O6H91_22G057700 [Diphasiastrum complanatum]KAJ7516417.1 hypothetical protein O6H91_22G057700 [Diphasiastrum complanatum]KAJ7516424.1 hypothetical protein O6H91_22G057700 [Diphasiastrum complanatum]KAJ7516429.1 hypothetical protein O6H91_22G057700 [Diphasiastrum complanatum]